MAPLTQLRHLFKLRRLDRSIDRAADVEQWRSLSDHHDLLSGAQKWKRKHDSELFDAQQIRTRYHQLLDLCETGVSEEILFALNEGLHGNMGGMGRSVLYQRSRRGTKTLIEDYVQTINRALAIVLDASDQEIPFEEKLDFFRRASHCFGRSALCLSGGGGLIYFHHGVVQALLEEGLLPDVLSGASAGAWMCAQIGTRTDAELRDYFQTKRYETSAYVTGSILKDMLTGDLTRASTLIREEICDGLIDDMTFQEAFEQTGRHINISIAPYERHQTSRLMNAITSPNVTIRSAIKASSSVPGVVEPVTLEMKDSRGGIKPYLRDRRWVDGSFSEDLPFKRLSRLFGINHYIVSMINPLALPFLSKDPRAAPDSVLKSIRGLTYQAGKEGLKTLRRLVAPGSRNRADALLGMVYNLLNQDYAGDINIILELSEIKTRYSLFDYKTEAEIEGLIQAGQRAAWPKLDQIRTATSISHTIDEALEQLEKSAIVEGHTLQKNYLTPR